MKNCLTKIFFTYFLGKACFLTWLGGRVKQRECYCVACCVACAVDSCVTGVCITDVDDSRGREQLNHSVVTGDLHAEWMWASVRFRLTLTFPAVPSRSPRSFRDGCPLPHPHHVHSLRCSCPLRTYPYKRIRRPVMETQGTRSNNLLLDTFFSDQSLFGCLGGGCEMSLAVVWEVCGWRNSVSHVGFICLTCWVHIHIVHFAWGVERSHLSLSAKGVASIIYSALQQRLCWCIIPSLWLQAWPKFPLPLLTRSCLLVVILLLLWHLNPDGEQSVRCDRSLLSASAASWDQARGRGRRRLWRKWENWKQPE